MLMIWYDIYGNAPKSYLKILDKPRSKNVFELIVPHQLVAYKH